MAYTMKMLPLMAMVSLSACTTIASDHAERANATISNATGKSIGSALISEKAGIVSLTIQAKGLPAGLHGVHLHTTGRCDGPAFTSAGSHLNPGNRQHGSHNLSGSHLGDIPNIKIAKDGAGATTVMLPGSWETLAPSILDSDGTAIVIHAAPDDYKSDPAGNSGPRIACGIFKPA